MKVGRQLTEVRPGEKACRVPEKASPDQRRTPPTLTSTPAAQIDGLQHQIDASYDEQFGGLTLPAAAAASGQGEQGAPARSLGAVSEASFGDLGRDEPQLLDAVLTAAKAREPGAWLSFFQHVGALKLERTRLRREAGELAAALGDAARWAASRHAPRHAPAGEQGLC